MNTHHRNELNQNLLNINQRWQKPSAAIKIVLSLTVSMLIDHVFSDIRINKQTIVLVKHDYWCFMATFVHMVGWSQWWITLQICPHRDLNSGGSDLWSNALPTRRQKRLYSTNIILTCLPNMSVDLLYSCLFISNRLINGQQQMW